jgi:hypothetical protein
LPARRSDPKGRSGAGRIKAPSRSLCGRRSIQLTIADSASQVRGRPETEAAVRRLSERHRNTDRRKSGNILVAIDVTLEHRPGRGYAVDSDDEGWRINRSIQVLPVRGPSRAKQAPRREKQPPHSAATPFVAWRSAISLRVNGMSSRPYSIASISGSKPRIRKWLMPRS